MNGNILIWLLLGVIFIGAAWWHARENRRLANKWRSELDSDSAERLVRFAWGRTAQLLYALACAIAVILVYDWQLGKSRQELSAIPKQVSIAPQISPQSVMAKPQIRMQVVPPRNLVPIQSKPAAPAAAPVKDNYYPPLVAQPAPAAKATIDDVYNPEKKSAGNEAAMDAIKKRYEDILVTYMFMKRCGKAGGNDYSVITSALAQEMASVNAPGRMQYDITTSAQGSYNEIYSKSSCSGPDVGTLATQYADYIKALSNNLAAH